MRTDTAIVDALAAYRLTRLVTKDVLLDELRDDIVRGAYMRRVKTLPPHRALPLIEDNGASWSEIAEHDGDAPKLATLITCRWCAGMWVSFGVIAARRYVPGLWSPIARALALSAAAALIAGLEKP